MLETFFFVHMHMPTWVFMVCFSYFIFFFGRGTYCSFFPLWLIRWMKQKMGEGSELSFLGKKRRGGGTRKENAVRIKRVRYVYTQRNFFFCLHLTFPLLELWLLTCSSVLFRACGFVFSDRNTLILSYAFKNTWDRKARTQDIHVGIYKFFFRVFG